MKGWMIHTLLLNHLATAPFLEAGRLESSMPLPRSGRHRWLRADELTKEEQAEIMPHAEAAPKRLLGTD
jgi:hypothetical protein